MNQSVDRLGTARLFSARLGKWEVDSTELQGKSLVWFGSARSISRTVNPAVMLPELMKILKYDTAVQKPHV